MVNQIESNFPTQSETVDDKRDHDVFSVKCDNLFGKRREFLSYKQLYQSVCKFQESWNGNLHMESMCIRYFYSRNNKARDNIVLAKEKKQKVS